MPEAPKEKPTNDEDVNKPSTWKDDQDEHEYYYDDAHGYEEYVEDPDQEDDLEITNNG